MYKAAVIDLDGTLLNDDRKVGTKDLRTLGDLGKKNILRIIATGRSLYSTGEVLPSDFPVDYLIFAAGAGIMNFKTKEIIKTHFIQAKHVKKTAEKLIKLKLDFQIRAKIPDSHKYVYKRFSEYNPDFDRLNAMYQDYSTELKEDYNFEDATRIIIISPNTDIVSLIENEFSEFGIIRASSPIDNKSVWMEIYPPGINKGNSLQYLCKMLNISLKDTIGIGNDYNDIHFLDITGKSYIVKNAPDSLKEKYKITVGNNENPLSEIFSNLI